VTDDLLSTKSPVNDRRSLAAGVASALRALTRRAPDDTGPDEIGYRSGNEHDPGDPFGLCVLTVRKDGTVHLHNRHRGSERHFEGRCATGVRGRLLAALAKSGFPAVPPHRIPAGPTRQVWTIGPQGEAFSPPMAFHESAGWPGYGDLFRLLDSLVVAVSRGALPVVPAPEGGLLST
jgi:hypothetical protein